MRTIVDANSIVSSVIGEQKSKDVDYRLMKYILSVETEDGLLLHNVVTGQLILLSDEETEAISRLPGKAEDAAVPLIAAYYLVPVEFNEYDFVRGYRKVLQQLEKNKPKPITKYTILPTTCCNAHCFYCFESNYEKLNMDEKTARKVADFIIRRADGNKVELSWFGGEPTIASDRINEICQILREHEVNYLSGMISNGYLFTEELVRKAVEDWKLQSIQITLDGTEEVYNKTKSFHVPESAYQRVLNNIQLLIDAGVIVTVLLNLDEHNRRDLYDLVDELAQRFSQTDNFRIASHVLFNDEGYEKVHHTYDQEENLIRENYRLIEYIRSAGLKGNVMGSTRGKNYLPKLRYLYCMVNDSGAVVIGPNGSFYKCEHLENGQECTTGLDGGCFDEKEIDTWFTSGEKPQCVDCPLFPECFVPKRCKDQENCFSVVAEQKLSSYIGIAKMYYDNFVQGEGAGINRLS